MRNYRIEYAESENNYTYTGGWDTEIIEAETAKEAIELLKAHFTENGGDPAEYIYRPAGLECVSLYGLDKTVYVDMRQETFTDDGTGCEIYVADTGEWIAQDDAIGEWVQVKSC